MERLETLTRDTDCVIYRIGSQDSFPVRRLIASLPESRSICNDPFLVGVAYTQALQEAMSRIIRILYDRCLLDLKERECSVFHILRGGLNFGIREAFASALGWNEHNCSFSSAQRVREEENPEHWYITEDSYRKIYFPKECSVVLGDVVATGTTFARTLEVLDTAAQQSDCQIKNLLFFTIGSPATENCVAKFDAKLRRHSLVYQGATVIYLEGRFAVAQPDTALRIKITGTDLIRMGSLLAPEFIESQYESPTYPIERCAIYDAGSRAFWLPEYYADLREYWSKCLELAKEGVEYSALLSERFPELDVKRFGDQDLSSLCKKQLSKCPECSSC